MSLRLAVVGLFSCLIAACGTASEAIPPDGSGNDFQIVAYQGEAILGGKQTSFSKVFAQGKPVVLNFWAGQCPPCRAEMPGFQRVYAELQAKVIIVGLDIGPFLNLGSHDDAVRLYKELGIQYPLAYAVRATPIQRYRVLGMPTTVFFNDKGEVVDQSTGILTEEQLRTTIQHELLATP